MRIYCYSEVVYTYKNRKYCLMLAPKKLFRSLMKAQWEKAYVDTNLFEVCSGVDPHNNERRRPLHGRCVCLLSTKKRFVLARDEATALAAIFSAADGRSTFEAPRSQAQASFIPRSPSFRTRTKNMAQQIIEFGIPSRNHIILHPNPLKSQKHSLLPSCPS